MEHRMTWQDLMGTMKLGALGIGCMAGLGSCGMTATRSEEAGRVSVPVSRGAGAGVEVTAYFFTVPDDFGFVKGQEQPGVAGTYSREVGEKLVQSLARRRGFELMEKAPVTSAAKAGEKREVKVVRDFIYPTEYEPPVLGKVIDGELQSVTPSTPTAFENKELGVVLGYEGRRAADGRIEFEFDLRRSAFLGFVNYGSPITTKRKGLFGRTVEVQLTENRIEMPVFDVRQVRSRIMVKDGDFIAVGGLMPNNPQGTPNFNAWKGAKKGATGQNFVALIQVRAKAGS